MCLSIPMRVVALEGDGDLAWVERAGRRELVNMMLIGPQPLGAWVLTSLGLAKEVVEAGATFDKNTALPMSLYTLKARG